MSTPFADTKTIRKALFDALDMRAEWYFHEGAMKGWTEDDANRERTAFVNMVLSRIADLHSIPGETVQLENLCPRHIKEALPAPTVGFCVQCSAEQKAKGQSA